MRKKILLFSSDPGGTNAIGPLVKPLQKQGYRVYVYGKGSSLNIYKEFSVSAVDISQKMPKNNELSTLNLIISIRPDLIITGTSANDFTERWLWKIASEQRIPSIAVLDQNINCSIRFSPFKLKENSHFQQNKVFLNLPSKIAVPDIFSKKSMVSDGIPKNKIVVMGHPFYEWIQFHRTKLSVIKASRKKIMKNRKFLFIYASEPITTDYPNNKRIYNQFYILDSIIKSLEKIDIKLRQNTILIIRPHPRESSDKYELYVKSVNKLGIRCIIDTKTTSSSLILMSDAVFGMTSMFLTEAILRNKPVISIQIGQIQKNLFSLTKIFRIKVVEPIDELNVKVKELFNGPKTIFYKNTKIINSRPIESLIAYVNKII